MINKQFELLIQLPNKVAFKDEVEQVDLCTTEGYCGILPNHIPLIGNVVASSIYIHIDGKIKEAIINKGIFNFSDNKLIVVADFFEFHDQANSLNDAIIFRNDMIKKSIENAEKQSSLVNENIIESLQISTTKFKTLSVNTKK